MGYDRTVALKFLATHLIDSEAHKQRFLREAKTVASLDHRNLSTVRRPMPNKDRRARIYRTATVAGELVGPMASTVMGNSL